jgi:hypothetical protein
MKFREWLISETTAGKTDLYPLGYGGIGLYPPQDYLTHSADAILYVTMDDRIYKGIEGAPFSILHIPGRPSSKINGQGEGPPFPIWQIKR